MFRLIFCFFLIIFSLGFSQNNYDNNMQKTGFWVGYYDSGEKRYEGNFED